MNRRNYAFDKQNFILLIIGAVAVILGFILMGGSTSDMQTFNNDIFSIRRIKVAPMVSLAGFIFIIYAIVRAPRTDNDEEDKTPENK